MADFHQTALLYSCCVSSRGAYRPILPIAPGERVSPRRNQECFGTRLASLARDCLIRF